MAGRSARTSHGLVARRRSRRRPESLGRVVGPGRVPTPAPGGRLDGFRPRDPGRPVCALRESPGLLPVAAPVRLSVSSSRARGGLTDEAAGPILKASGSRCSVEGKILDARGSTPRPGIRPASRPARAPRVSARCRHCPRTSFLWVLAHNSGDDLTRTVRACHVCSNRADPTAHGKRTRNPIGRDQDRVDC